MRFVNTAVHARVWTHLVNAETGATLELAPGAEAEVDVQDGFTDPYLRPVQVRSEKPRSSGADTPKAVQAEEKE